ncbi:hypothetical protein [Vibrio algicola]|uniref:Uncharacterized protein n=1 Tax=Vibrio algicola TaxID=2662262 RepID=A0A5Q0THI7_9VIBR|nr:hypothetical protein [Vibrio algicola]
MALELSSFDKRCALQRIMELDRKLNLTEDEKRDYQNRIEIVEEFDRQHRNTWKSERRSWIKAQLIKKMMTKEQSEKKLSELDIDADLILGRPSYPWRLI